MSTEALVGTDLVHAVQCCCMKNAISWICFWLSHKGCWKAAGTDNSVVAYVCWNDLNWGWGDLPRTSLVLKKIPKSYHCAQFSAFAAEPFFLKLFPTCFSVTVCDFLFNLCTLKLSHCNVRHCFVSSEENILQNGVTHQPWLRSKLLKRGRGYSLGNSVKRKKKKKDTIEILKE